MRAMYRKSLRVVWFRVACMQMSSGWMLLIMILKWSPVSIFGFHGPSIHLGS